MLVKVKVVKNNYTQEQIKKVQMLVEQRHTAKREKNYKYADILRERIISIGNKGTYLVDKEDRTTVFLL